MFTWNLPALTRNAVLFTVFCIAVSWNTLAWFFIFFIVFVEMDEELTKYESYSDYYASQLALYDFSKINTSGWNLEEQLRIFNQQNPELVQQYQRTFNSRIQELRKQPKTTKPQGKEKRRENNRQKIKVKAEVFGYTENYWDEEQSYPTNEFVEMINHISSVSMYEWYHLNGLIIPEQEYGIKNICLYQDKYSDIEEDIQYKPIVEQNIKEFYDSSMNKAKGNLVMSNKMYIRNNNTIQTTNKELRNNLLYWTMSGYQKAKYNNPSHSVKSLIKYKDTRINAAEHIKQLSTMDSKQCLANATSKLRTNVFKQTQISTHTVKTRYSKHSNK